MSTVARAGGGGRRRLQPYGRGLGCEQGRHKWQQQVAVHACYGSSSFRLLTAASNVRWPQLTRGSLEAFVVWCRVCAVVRVLCVTR